MVANTVTIARSFSVPTENRLLLPRRYDPGRSWPLVIALHGMGMTAPEFAGLLEPLRRLPCLLFVPEGVYPYEIRTGQQMRIGRAWYLYTGDEAAFVRSMDRSGRHLRALEASVAKDHAVDASRVFLLGFSQGGYFAGYHAVRHARRYRGAVIVGARVKHEVLARELRRARHLSVLHLHGRKDRAVPFPLAEKSRDALVDAGIEVRLQAFDQGHAMTTEQVAAAARWLRARFRSAVTDAR